AEERGRDCDGRRPQQETAKKGTPHVLDPFCVGFDAKGTCRVEFPRYELRMNQMTDARQVFSRDRMQKPRMSRFASRARSLYNDQ
ncbi:MAG: hypothetical protein ACM337_03045, partial [Syntrophaceae bacterium]